MNNNKLFIKADEIAAELGISKPYAYKLIRKLNEELSAKGFITKYFEEKIYGETTRKEVG